jgi:Rieske 2Fe-2S family protein
MFPVARRSDTQALLRQTLGVHDNGRCASLATLIERPTYFTGLPREYYVSNERYELEIERIWMRSWLFFGHLSQIPEVGDYLVREMFGESIGVVRLESGDVSGFFNVCRHRGFRICNTGQGKANPLGRAQAFTCRYHRWSYHLDGRLRMAPSMPDGEFFDYAGWGLFGVHVEVWHGFIFVNLSEKPPEPLTPILEEYAQSLIPLEPESMKVAHVVVDQFEANWKIASENFHECYHCPGEHPELCKVSDFGDSLPFTQALEGANNQHDYMGGHWFFKPGAQSWSRDGAYVSTKMLGVYGRGTEPDGRVAFFQLHPAPSAFTFGTDCGFTQEVRPVSRGRTQYVTHWFVHQDAVEGIDYNLDELIYVRDATNKQDVRLIEGTQHGVSSRRYVAGPYSSTREPGVRNVLNAYLRVMGERTES